MILKILFILMHAVSLKLSWLIIKTMHENVWTHRNANFKDVLWCVIPIVNTIFVLTLYRDAFPKEHKSYNWFFNIER